MPNKNTIYQTIYEYLCNRESVVNIDRAITEFPKRLCSVMDIGPLIELCAALREDMRMEANKASGKANVAKAMKAIIKTAGKDKLRGAFDCEGKQCVCDGHRAIRLNSPIEMVSAQGIPSDGMKTVFDEAMEGATVPLDLPTMAELKAHYRIKKAESIGGFINYDFGGNLPAVQANYLIDILTAFPDAKAFATESPNKPLYFTCEAGDAVLLPVRIQGKQAV